MLSRWILGVFVFAVSGGCAVTDREIDGPVFCSINQTETLNLGTTDPTTDFNVTNQVKSVTFNSVDCPQVDNEGFDAFVGRVKRVGNVVTVVENLFSPGEMRLDFLVSGTTLLPIESSNNISNCTIKRRWTGTINGPGNNIAINEVITYKGSCQSTFYNPDLDTTNPGQN